MVETRPYASLPPPLFANMRLCGTVDEMDHIVVHSVGEVAWLAHTPANVSAHDRILGTKGISTAGRETEFSQTGKL